MTNPIENLYAQLMSIVGEVPFGNSDFQNRAFVVDSEHTPARAYRHAALRIVDRINALQEAYYSRRRGAIQLKILQRDAANEEDELKRQLILLDIERATASAPYTDKLIRDAIREIESLWPIIAGLGALSRSKFEAGELGHFEKRLGKKIPIEGDLYETIRALTNGDSSEVPDFKRLLDEARDESIQHPKQRTEKITREE